MNWPNSLGEISPRPLNRVTSAARERLHRRVALLFAVAVPRLLLVAHAEQRRFQYVNMAGHHEVLEVGEEKRHEQVADMEPVDVGVGGDHDAVVPQVFDVLLDAQRHHQVVQLFVLVNGRAVPAEHVFRLALERENRLGLHVARGNDGAGGGLPFGEEDRGFLAALRVAQMILAVFEVRDLDLDALGRLLGLFLDRVELFAQLLVLHDLAFQALALSGFLCRKSTTPDLTSEMTQPRISVLPSLFLVCDLEHRRLELYRDGARDAFAHVEAGVVLFVKLVDAFEDALAERGQVRAAVAGELAINKRKIGLAVVGGMGEGEFEELRLVMADGVHGALAHLLLKQVQKPVFRLERLLVEDELEAGVEAGVIPEPALDVLIIERIFAEELGVGRELDERAVVLAFHAALALGNLLAF